MLYIIYNSWEPTFWGAFLGAFFSFWFYLLAFYLPKLLKKLWLKVKAKKKLKELYQLLLLERTSDTFFFDLIEIFTLEKVEDFLKGLVRSTGDLVNFMSESWEIIIVNRIFESRFAITDINDRQYCLDANHKDINIEVLSNFIQYFEERCKQEKIKLRTSEELKKAKETLTNL